MFGMRSNQKQFVEVIRIKCRAQVCHNVRSLPTADDDPEIVVVNFDLFHG